MFQSRRKHVVDVLSFDDESYSNHHAAHRGDKALELSSVRGTVDYVTSALCTLLQRKYITRDHPRKGANFPPLCLPPVIG